MSNYVISISREFGSGGRLVGKKLAARLGIPCYDRTIIQRTAERSGLSAEFIARAEERARSRFHLSLGPMGMGGFSSFAQPGVPVSNQAFFVQAEVIREMAEQGPCVIVGRCSDYILGEDPNCLKVFIHGSKPDRAQRCVTEYQMPVAGVEQRIAEVDRGRSNYYNYYTGCNWGEMRRYDLTVNSSLVGVDGAVDLIVAMVEARDRARQQADQQQEQGE